MSGSDSEIRRLPAKADNAASGGLSAIVDRVGRNVSNLYSGAGRVVNRVSPYISTAIDYAWFAGSTALLLAIPVLIEVQRETTVMVMQKQREAELMQIQEQARAQQAGFADQLKGLGALIGGAAGQQQ